MSTQIAATDAMAAISFAILNGNQLRNLNSEMHDNTDRTLLVCLKGGIYF